MRLVSSAAATVAIALIAGMFVSSRADGDVPVAAVARGGENAIQVENALPGSSAALTPSTATRAIEGYASEVSALPGDTLHFHVSTDPAAPYRVEIYRLGWYGGAGERLIGCTPSCSSWSAGQSQPMPAAAADGTIRAGWPVNAQFSLPSNATSGYYRIRFVVATGETSETYVIVRAPAGQSSAILVQVPVNTWQAYNSWGGRSLYDIAGAAARANRVSFDRPYAFAVPGDQGPLGWEYPLVLFLEKSGYDVSYQTDLDTEQDPSSLLGHKLVIDIGHDEYWTENMRDAFQSALAAKVNLAFMGADAIYWRIRYEDNGRTIVVYKAQDDPVTDPALRTGLFRVVGRFECELMGIQHEGGLMNWQPSGYSIVPSSLSNPWFANTGFAAGSSLPGIVSVETDSIPSNQTAGSSCGTNLTVYFQYNAGSDLLGNADATSYVAPSGATVFAAGSLQFSWGLADPPAITGRAHGLVDPRLQQFVTNMLDDLSVTHVVNLRMHLTTPATEEPVGKTFKLLATVTNAGPDAASGTTLDLALPTGLTFVKVLSKGLSCTIAPLQCTFDRLLPGSTTVVALVVRGVRPGRQRVALRAVVRSATDPDPTTAAGQVTLQVTRRIHGAPSATVSDPTITATTNNR